MRRANSSVRAAAARPLCSTDVTIPPTIAEPAEEAALDELDHARITQRATLRRALYRSRSHAVIAAVVCAVAVVQLGAWSYRSIQLQSSGFAATYLVLLVGGLIGAAYFCRRAIAIHQEVTRSQSLSSNRTDLSPDFSPLSNGSQRVRNLNDVR